MLTYDEIDNLSVGAEIDRLIAKKVMGQERTASCPLGDPTCDGKYEPQVGHWPCLPYYSTDIAAAWQVVEHLRTQNWYLLRLTNGDNNYACYFGRGIVQGPYGYAVGDTAPLAICKAALKVIAEA
jgi:hypothetical protein